MLASLLQDLWMNPEYIFSNPITILLVVFQIWMFIDSCRRREWLWAACILIFSVISAMLYFFLVYRQSAPLATQGFELPGTHKRKRIKELQAQIYHLNKAHHHAELGDIYFQEGKLKEAEASYRKAIELDASDPDFHAHLGQCLLRQNRPGEARPLLESVCKSNPQHDYGHTMMAYAETLAKIGFQEDALKAWRSVLDHHSYARARVQHAELLIAMGRSAEGRQELEDLILDETYATSFNAKRDKVWVKKAKQLLKS